MVTGVWVCDCCAAGCLSCTFGVDDVEFQAFVLIKIFLHSLAIVEFHMAHFAEGNVQSAGVSYLVLTFEVLPCVFWIVTFLYFASDGGVDPFG